MKVEVVYASPIKQTCLSVDIAEGSTVQQAIEQSTMLNLHPEIDLQSNAVGIFSQKVPLNRVLVAGDRVEIYRQLTQDPNTRRLAKLKRRK